MALQNFLMQYRYANANNQVDAADSSHSADQPYPDTRMLVDALMAQTPPEFRYLVDDGFNRIVLYDNKAISAASEKTPDGKYKVTLNVQARKVQADGNGVESPMPLADYIDIGVFNGKKDEEKPLVHEEGKAHPGAPDLHHRCRPAAHPRRYRPVQQTDRPHRR